MRSQGQAAAVMDIAGVTMQAKTALSYTTSKTLYSSSKPKSYETTRRYLVPKSVSYFGAKSVR